MGDLLPDIFDGQEIKTKIIIDDSEDENDIKSDNENKETADPTEVITETQIDLTKVTTNEHNHAENDNTGQNSLPNDILDFILHEEIGSNDLQERKDYFNSSKETKDKPCNNKRKVDESLEVCQTNQINSTEKLDSNTYCNKNFPRKKYSARRKSIQNSQINSHSSSQPSIQITVTKHNISDFNNATFANDLYHNDAQPINCENNLNETQVIPHYQVFNVSKSIFNNNKQNNKRFQSHPGAQKFDLLGIKTIAQSIVNVSLNIITSPETSTQSIKNILHCCFKILYPITLKILPKMSDPIFVDDLIKLTAEMAEEQKSEISEESIKLILAKLIIWTQEEQKKIEVQYRNDTLTSNLANTLLNIDKRRFDSTEKQTEYGNIRRYTEKTYQQKPSDKPAIQTRVTNNGNFLMHTNQNSHSNNLIPQNTTIINENISRSMGFNINPTGINRFPTQNISISTANPIAVPHNSYVYSNNVTTPTYSQPMDHLQNFVVTPPYRRNQSVVTQSFRQLLSAPIRPPAYPKNVLINTPSTELQKNSNQTSYTITSQHAPVNNLQYAQMMKYPNMITNANFANNDSSSINITETNSWRRSNIISDHTQPINPVNNNYSILNQTTIVPSPNPERSSSRDSGFMSPPADNVDITSTTISHVTSLNNDVSDVFNIGQCVVCKRATKIQCLLCFKSYYCSTKCQYMDWNGHDCRIQHMENPQ